MIELFYPPKIQHKNAVKIKGYASVGGADEIENLEGWLKKQEKEQVKKTLAEKIKASRISDLRKAMIEAEKAYEKAFKKYQEMGLEVRRLRAAKDNRARSYRRAAI